MSASICFVGLENLPVLARDYNHHGIGGEQVQHTLLAKALAAHGYDVSMIVADYGQADGATWDGIRTFKAYDPKKGLPVIRFLHPRCSGLWFAAKRANADIYYVSCASMQVGLFALFARVHRRKLIFRIASDTDCEPDRLLIQHHYKRDKAIYEYGLRRTDAILAQSVKQQQMLKKNYGLSSDLAPMMIDQGEADRTFESRSIGALWVSNIRQLKRPDIFMGLARQVPEAHFDMIGGPQPGADDLYENVRTEAASIKNLTFHGRVSYHDVHEFYARARVFVNTSEIEGFPNSYLQAWASGTPVVAFFDPDGLIKREGLGVAAHDLKEMQGALRSLVSNPEEWRATSERCRAFMEREFGRSKILAPYLKLIDKLAPATSK